PLRLPCQRRLEHRRTQMNVWKWPTPATAAAVFLASATASAQEAATAGKPSVGAGIRYGLEMNEGDSNPWGFGLGARGGYTLDFGLYVGGAFEYYFGDSEDFGGGNEVSFNIWQLMAEVGYDVGLGDQLVLRPKAGVRLASLGGEVCIQGTCASDSESNLLLAPGVEFQYVGDGFFVGAEARYDFIFADPETANALVLGASGGVLF